MTYRCDGCDTDQRGQRVVFTTEATDERGIDVVVCKRWVVCPSCADEVFTRIGEPSPWDDASLHALVYPDQDASRTLGG